MAADDGVCALPRGQTPYPLPPPDPLLGRAQVSASGADYSHAAIGRERCADRRRENRPPGDRACLCGPTGAHTGLPGMGDAALGACIPALRTPARLWADWDQALPAHAAPACPCRRDRCCWLVPAAVQELRRT